LQRARGASDPRRSPHRAPVDLGADPANLAGVDVSTQRLEIARRSNPAISWQELEEDGVLPFEDDSFDLVLQTVVFSSILDAELRDRLAAEMRRVCRRHILWQDLQDAEAAHVHSFTREEIAGLFPGLRVVYERPCSPSYFRRWYRHRTLCLVLSRLTSRECESVLLVLEQPA
jgi:ubiquinone/menaquinone biosynthesis C-methylase UbiE